MRKRRRRVAGRVGVSFSLAWSGGACACSVVTAVWVKSRVFSPFLLDGGGTWGRKVGTRMSLLGYQEKGGIIVDVDTDVDADADANMAMDSCTLLCIRCT